MKLAILGISTLFIIKAVGVEYGSLMTTAEEAEKLQSDTQVNEAVVQSSCDYEKELSLYRQGTLSYDALQTQYASTFSELLCSVKSLIAEDSTGTIAPIQNDYDSAHASDYEDHLRDLIGIMQNELNIPAYQCILPPLDSYSNLLDNGDFSEGSAGWQITGGSGTLIVNSPDPYDTTSPVENKNSLSFSGIPSQPGYISVSQDVATVPGHLYLVGGYVMGTPPSSGDGAYSGGIDVVGAVSLTSSITGKTKGFPQNSNEIDQAGLHRRFFWLTASGNSMRVSLSGGEKTVFKNIVVIDVTNISELMDYATSVFPQVSPLGDPDVGHYPQVESKLNVSDNLLDGLISIQKNIDQSPLKNAGHPYWYIDGSIPANHEIKLTNALNGAHALYMPKNASVTSNGPVPCPIGDYTLHAMVFVPEGGSGSVNLQFAGTSLIDNAALPKISQTFTSLSSGQVTPIQIKISADEFENMQAGTFFRPSVILTSLEDTAFLFDVSLIPDDSTLYDQINDINPYNPDRSWYQKTGCTQTYDFTSGIVSSDWAVALTGNTMFAPGSPASDFTKVTSNGIQLISVRDNQSSPPYANGGIQSTQFIPSGRDFTVEMTFVATNDESVYEPTVALWTYGESQRGPDNPIYHTHAPGADPITEFDCEMGSDISPKIPPPQNSVCVRDGSYIGHAVGGHGEYFDAKPDGAAIWKVVPNFWDGQVHTLKVEGKYNEHNRLILNRILDGGSPFSTQDLGTGPFSPMYIKIALENPSWNSRGFGNGKAQLEIQSLSITISPPHENVPTIPLDQIDYAWFTPGGGGGCSYTPF